MDSEALVAHFSPNQGTIIIFFAMDLFQGLWMFKSMWST